MFSLEGKTALITGAAGGIGREITKTLHAQGAKVGISGRNIDALKALQAELGDNVTIFKCDLSDKESVANLAKEAEETLGQVDILVCNAGLTKDNLVLRMKDADWDEVIDVNLTATFKLNRDIVKKMIRRKWGRIINISSVVGVAGNPGQANYVASKAGMIGMSKSIGLEVASRGITVNCIAPGFIASPMTEALTDDQKSAITNNIAAKKLGSPADIAAGVLFLSSEEAQYITGQTLHINGGMLMV